MLTDKRTARDESVGHNPDVEEHHEVVDQEAETESLSWGMAGSLRDKGRSHGHGVDGRDQCSVVSGPVLRGSKNSSSNRTHAVECPRAREVGCEQTDEKTKAHREEGDGTMRDRQWASDGIALPDPGDHSAGV